MAAKDLETVLLQLIEPGMVLAIGTSALGERLLKKLGMKIEKERLKVAVIPTSFRFTKLLHKYKIPVANINEQEIDVAVMFADSIDEDFNFVKRNSTSLVRDKMIAMSAFNLIVIPEEGKLRKQVKRLIPVEVVEFGLQKSLLHLENLGKPLPRMQKGRPLKTETGNYLIDLVVDSVYSLGDIEIETKRVPGVIETGLFLGYADTVVLRKGESFTIKSRLKK